MNEEITKMSLLITHLDVSVETKNKLYTQNYKIATEIERLNNIIDELVLECYNSSLGLGEFSRIWRIAFNEDYQPNKIDKLKELKGSDEE